jgi:hypothetical protein
VLKEIPGPWRPSPLVEEFGCHQLCQPRLQGVLILRSNGLEQVIGKLPPQHRTELRHLFRRIELIQARHERILQRLRNRYRTQRPGEPILGRLFP